MADELWLRQRKWEQFYAGTFAPHLASAQDVDPGIDALPWRTAAPTESLVDYVEDGRLPHGCRAIELGCGTGENLVYLSKDCAFVLGVDIVPAAVDASEAALRRAAVTNAQACCADILALTQPALQDGGPWRFDFVLDVQTFHCLRKVDPDRAAAVYGELVAPGGTLLLLTGNADEPAERGPEILTEAEVRSAFDGTALRCESCTAFRFEWTSHYRRQVFEEPPLGWRSVWRKPAESV